MSDRLGNNLALARATTYDSVVNRLRMLILNHHFRPGDRLVERELAVTLGVSRTPIREGLHTLATEGFVTISPYRGASVAQFSAADLKEIYSVRLALEGFAANLAAQNITEKPLQRLEELLDQMEDALKKEDFPELLRLNRQFHMGIYAAANRKRLYDLIGTYIDLAGVYRRIFASLDYAREELVNHREVLLALREGNAEGAERLTRCHLENTAETLVEFLEAQEAKTEE